MDSSYIFAIIWLIMFLAAFIILSPLVPNDVSPVEQPHMYWKMVDCEIVDYRFNLAVPALCSGYISVVSEEYDLQESFSVRKYEAAKLRSYVRHYKTIKVEMDSWVMDSTGEVIKRQLSHSFSFEQN